TASGSNGTPAVTYDGLRPVDTTTTQIANLIFNLKAATTDGLMQGLTTGTSALIFATHSNEDQFFQNPSSSLTINEMGGASIVQLGTMASGFGPGVITLTGMANDQYVGEVDDSLPAGSALTLTTALLDLNGFRDTVGGLNGNGTVTNNIAATNSTLTVNGGGAFAGVIRDGSGSVTLTKLATGTLTLSGAHTYSRDTNLQNGTLAIGAHNALPIGTTVNLGSGDNNATVDLNNFDQTVGAIAQAGGATGANTITNTGAVLHTLTVTPSGTDGYAGQLTGARLALTMAGTGTLSL